MTTYESTPFTKSVWTSAGSPTASLNVADFGAFGQSLEETLVGLGLVFVSRDVDWSTDPLPNAAPNTAVVNTIYRMPGGVSLPDIYIKFGIGRGDYRTTSTDVSGQFGVKVAVGLDGVDWPISWGTINAGVYTSTNGHTWMGCLTEAGFYVLFDNAGNGTYYPTIICVERGRKTSGEVSDDCVFASTWGMATGTVDPSVNGRVQTTEALRFSDQETFTATLSSSIPAIGASGILNNHGYVAPATYSVGQGVKRDSDLFLVTPSTVSGNTTITVGTTGQDRTYRTPTGLTWFPSNLLGTRWE